MVTQAEIIQSTIFYFNFYAGVGESSSHSALIPQIVLLVMVNLVTLSVLQIRELDLTSSNLRLIMGNGTSGGFGGLGDGGDALQAQVTFPSGVAVAFNGDIYFTTA